MSLLNEFTIKVDKKFIIKLLSGTVNFNRAVKESCKVISISTECNPKELPLLIDKLSPKEYPKLFVFVIEATNFGFKTAKNDDQDNIKQLMKSVFKFCQNRPVILQMISKCEDENRFYYKDGETLGMILSKNDLANIPQDNSFGSLLRLYVNGEIQNVDRNLISKLTQSQNSILNVLFLRLLYLEKNTFERIIVEVAKKRNTKTFTAALDASFENRILNYDAQAFLSEVFSDGSSDEKNSSVFLIALKNRNEEVINYLITYWSNLLQKYSFKHQVKISSTALETNQLNVLCDLIEIADFPFPKEFNIDLVNCERLRKIINARKKFEAAIKDENFDHIDDFIDENSSLKTVYSTENISAMEQAVKSGKYETYFYLKSFGFKIDNLEEILTEEETEQLEMQAKEKALRHSDNPVMILETKSFIHNRRISKEDEVVYRIKIKKWLFEIKKIKYGSELLSAAASSENLKIIFDFESTMEYRADLMRNASASYETISSNIFIGAKLSDKKRDQEIKGILAHELCHHVLHLVYENGFLPYYKYNTEIEASYSKIVQAFKNAFKKSVVPDDECNKIISSVLTDTDYFPCYDVELIVRTVHILAQFDDDAKKSNYLVKKYQMLFNFWEKYVLTELKQYDPKLRKRVEKLNKYIGLLPVILNENIKIRNSFCLPDLTGSKLLIILAKVPKLFLINICKSLKENYGKLYDRQNIFIEPTKLKNFKIWNDFNDLCKQVRKLNIFVDCSSEIPDYLGYIFVNKELNFIFLVKNENQHRDLMKKLNMKEVKNSSKIEINYSWSDLTEDSQKLLLQTKINFQNDNSEISLFDLLKIKDNDSMQNLLLTENFNNSINANLLYMLVEKEQIKVNCDALDNLDEKQFELQFQERKFLKDSNPSKSMSESEFLTETSNEKYVLISNNAGSGKTWVMKHFNRLFRKEYQNKWVNYIDLKEFKEELKEKNHKLDFVSFIVKKILKLKEFERCIFEHLYKNGKVIILFDGFDEVAPDCAEIITNLAKSFKRNNGNQLWITTRDYYRADLFCDLNLEETYRIDKLSKEQSKSLIAEIWFLSDLKDQTDFKSRNDLFKCANKSSVFEKYLSRAEKALKDFNFSDKSFGTPQILKMIAEGFKIGENTNSNLNLKEIYSKFIEKLCNRWSLKRDKIWMFHQFCAVQNVFPEILRVLFPNYDESNWPIEKEINACGLVIKSSGSYVFLHETFQEFFVADVIAKILKESKYDQFLRKKYYHKDFYLIITKILTESKYSEVQVFLNDSIDLSIIDSIFMEMKKYLLYFYKIEKLPKMFTANLVNLADLVLKILKNGEYNAVQKIIFERADEISLNIKNPELFEKFYSFVFEFLKLDDLKSFLIKKDFFLNILKSTLDIEVFKKVLDEIKSKFKYNNNFIENLLKQKTGTHYDQRNIFSCLAECENLTNQKMQISLEIAKSFMSLDEIFKLMYSCTSKDDCILYFAYERNLKIIWIEIENFFKHHNKHNLFIELAKRQSIYNERSVYSYRNRDIYFNHNMILLGLLSNTFSNKNELFDFAFKNGRYFLVMFYEFRRIPSYLLELYKAIKEMFTKDQMKKMLIPGGYWDKNIMRPASQDYESTIIIIWYIFKDTYDFEELLKIIKISNKCGRNILHEAIENENPNIFEFIMESLEAITTPDEIKKLMISFGDYTNKLLYLASKNQSQRLHQILWTFMRKYLKRNEILNFIKFKDFDGENILYFSVNEHVDIIDGLKVTWNEIKYQLSYEEQMNYIIETKRNKENLVDIIIGYDSKEIKKSYEWAKERLLEYKICKYDKNNKLVKM